MGNKSNRIRVGPAIYLEVPGRRWGGDDIRSKEGRHNEMTRMTVSTTEL